MATRWANRAEFRRSAKDTKRVLPEMVRGASMCLKEPLAWIFGIFSVADWQRLVAGAHHSPVSGNPTQGSTAAVHRVRQSAQSGRLQMLPHLAKKDHGAATRYAG